MPSAASSVQIAFDFLTCIARPQLAKKRAQALLRSGVDFAELMRLAEQHTVRPQLIGALAEIGWHDVPPDVRAKLEAYRHAHLARALLYTDELRRIALLFERQGIRYAVFKGVALARLLYGDSAAREYNDIDVIVPSERMADAERALGTLGYRGAQGDPEFRSVFLSYLRQYSLVREDGLVAVDLHWEFSGSHVPFPIGAADIWHALHVISIGPHEVRTIAGANLALLLAGHGTKEQWRCLEWINDFAHVIVGMAGLDWTDIHARASRAGCGGSVLLGATLAERLLDIALPDDLARLVRADRRIADKARELIDRLRSGAPPPEATPNFTDIDLCDRSVDRMKAVLQLVLRPTVSDHGSLPLPRAMWPVYYVTRPFRLAAMAAGRLVRRH